ncbi:MAG: hypothetical protein KH431_10155 [Erysipelotrichaceae bacterium]|nr:hypothetical protein [Erysipelotrichaceae bacterium]
MLNHLLKLMKYELKCTYRSFGLVYVVILAASFFLTPNSDGSQVAMILAMIYGIAIGTLVVMIFVTVIRNYYTSMFQKQGYLTQTLPVKSYELISSKLLIAYFWIVVSVLIIIISTFIIAFKANNASFNDILEVIRQLLQATMDRDFWLILGYFIITPLEAILLFYLTMTAVHTKYVRKHRVLIGIALYFVISYAVSYVTDVILSLSSGAFDTAFYQSVSVVQFRSEAQTWMMLGFSAVLAVVYFIGTCYILDHKLEIE